MKYLLAVALALSPLCLYADGGYIIPTAGLNDYGETRDAIKAWGDRESTGGYSKDVARNFNPGLSLEIFNIHPWLSLPSFSVAVNPRNGNETYWEVGAAVYYPLDGFRVFAGLRTGAYFLDGNNEPVGMSLQGDAEHDEGVFIPVVLSGGIAATWENVIVQISGKMIWMPHDVSWLPVFGVGIKW